MPDPNDAEPDQPTEGVRIIGAAEAGASVEGDEHDDAERPEVRPRRPVRFPSDGPTWSAGDAPEEEPADAGVVGEADAEEVGGGDAEEVGGGDAGAPPAEEPTGEVQLPHWTEPPSGRVPAVTGEGEDDLDAWAALSGGGPRFRSEDADWAEADYREGDLTDEHTRLGALVAEEALDEDEEFAEEIAARRRGGRRPPPSDRPAPPPARPTPRPAPSRPARPAPAEPAGPAGGRDLPTAIATAGIVTVVALLCLNAGQAWTSYFAAVAIGLAALELSNGLRARGHHPAVPLALVASAGLVLAAREYAWAAYPVVTLLVAVFSLVWFLWQVSPGRPVDGVASTMLVFGYVGVLGGFAGLMLASPDGIGLIYGAAITAIAYDVVGFFVGSQFGKSHIAPRVSPNKTFEGTLAGMTASVVLGWAIVGQIHPWSGARGLVLGLLVAVAAFLGDLCESMVKRDLGIKDFGSILPGHGGVLDRFDSILFALPVTFYLAAQLDILHLAL